jgi:ketosteroid isomerase-like protein
MTADQQAEAGARAAFERLHEAMNAIMAGDAGPIKALCSHRDDATAFLGWGGYEHGWAQVGARWDWAAEQFRGGGPVTYDHIAAVFSPTLAYTIDIEHIQVQLDQMNAPTGWSNRVTHIFRLEDGEWRLVHRHGNRLEAQYKPGPRLEERARQEG